ncbi:unnamed protein product [Caenorhabditis brenneri]
MSTSKTEQEKKPESPRKTLSLEKLTEIYNLKFEIEEELEVLGQVVFMDVRRRIRELKMQFDAINNLILVGERNHSKKNASLARRQIITLENLQRH